MHTSLKLVEVETKLFLRDSATVVFDARAQDTYEAGHLPGARVLPVGTTDFFTCFEAQRGRKRVEMVASMVTCWSATRARALVCPRWARLSRRPSRKTMSLGVP